MEKPAEASKIKKGKVEAEVKGTVARDETEKEEGRREWAKQARERFMPVLGATPTLRRGKNRGAVDRPDSLPTKGRLEEGAGWPVDQLREEQEPEFQPDYVEEASLLREYAEVNNIELGNIDLYGTGPHLATEVERAKALFGILVPEEIVKRKKIRKEAGRVVKLAEAGSAREENVIDVSVDLFRLISSKTRKEIVEMAGGSGQVDKFIAKFWGNDALQVVIYDKSDNYPPRLRLIDPETKLEIFMSISEWQNMLSSKSMEIRFPSKHKTIDDKANWILALKAIRIGGGELGAKPDHIYFTTDPKFSEEVVPVITEINAARRRKKNEKATRHASHI